MGSSEQFGLVSRTIYYGHVECQILIEKFKVSGARLTF